MGTIVVFFIFNIANVFTPNKSPCLVLLERSRLKAKIRVLPWQYSILLVNV